MTSVHHGQKFFLALLRREMANYHELQATLERVRSPKQANAQATTVRMGQLDQSLAEILKAESQLLDLKERIEAAL